MRARRLAPASRTTLQLQPLEDRAQPSAGTLDPTFDGDGIAVTPIGTYGGSALDLMIQPDGKLVAAGTAWGADFANEHDFVVTRYRSDGSLDPTFGTGGIARIDVQGRSNSAEASALQPDGKILVAGETLILRGGDYERNATLVRLNANGTVDTAFGGKSAKGKVVTEVVGANTYERILDLAVLPDGKIVAVGETSSRPFVLRYRADGTLDPTFDGDGKVVFELNGAIAAAAPTFAVQPDGKLIVGGNEVRPLPVPVNGEDRTVKGRLFRLNANGSLDTTFGAGGVVLSDHMDNVTNVVLSNGRVVAAGSRGGMMVAVAKYNADGSPDSTFGDDVNGDLIPDGYTVPVLPGGSIGGGYTSDATLDATGRIIFAGSRPSPTEVNPNGAQEHDFAIARLNPDGSVDTTFGSGGVTVTDLTGTDDEWFNAVGIQADGKIVAAGSAIDPATGRRRFAVARYLGDELAVGGRAAAPAEGTTAGTTTAPVVLPAPAGPTRRFAHEARPNRSTGQSGKRGVKVIDLPAAARPLAGTFIPAVGSEKLVAEFELRLS